MPAFFNADGSTRIQGGWDVGEGNAAFDLDGFLAGLGAATPGADTDLYFNLHSVNDAAGLIRGHIVAVPARVSSRADAGGPS